MKKNKAKGFSLRVLGFVITLALPIWAICEKFPVWKKVSTPAVSAGVGIMLIVILVIVTFRKMIWTWLERKFNLHSLPPVCTSLIALSVVQGLISINSILYDVRTVLFAWFIGCAIGTVFDRLAYLVENKTLNEIEVEHGEITDE